MDQNNYQGNTPNNDNKNFAIGALICGIVSFFIPITGIVAIVLAVKAKKMSSDNNGMVTAGLVLGIIGLVFSTIYIACVICGSIAIAMDPSLYY